MNYYNPYFYSIPSTLNIAPRVGLFSRLFGNSSITFSSILGGTQKVLNVANQAIPLIQQVRPMISNSKTMFKVMNEFKKNDITTMNNTNNNTNNNIITDNHTTNTENIISENSNGNPTFFA